MKVLHLNTYDITGGAARAVYRIFKGLQNNGTTAMMLVQDKITDEQGIIPAHAMFGPHYRPVFDRFPLKFYPNRLKGDYHLAWLPDNLAKHVERENPDIVHIHWIT